MPHIELRTPASMLDVRAVLIHRGEARADLSTPTLMTAWHKEAVQTYARSYSGQ